MPNKFSQIATIMRFGIPSGYLLVFFPATYGLLLSLKDPTSLLLLPLLFIGSVLARGAGCVINDIFDRNLDSKVERTKSRPLASGAMKVQEALFIAVFTLSICLVMLLSLSVTSIVVGIIAFFMMIVYPLMKRLTYFPQFFLGGTFNLGVLIAYALTDDQITFEAMVLYLGCCFWTMGYDTIYAFMDIKDDKMIGVKSTAIFFEKGFYKPFIAICYMVFIALFIKANLLVRDDIIPVIGGIMSLIILMWQVYTLDIRKQDDCLVRFNSNQLVGLILFLSMLLEHLI